MNVRGLADLIAAGGVVALTGAGISTDSGIPDYRGTTGQRRRTAPMTHQEFLRDPAARRRYWARSHVGWALFSQARPNAGHRVLADLEEQGLVAGVITQNVDGLHQMAGSPAVIDLHGRLDRVVCLQCAATSDRAAHDERLREANAAWRASVRAHHADGDVELDPDDIAGFTLVDCAACGGPLKPDVVYFGDSVPRQRVQAATDLVDAASALLVLGSSLQVFSGRRFVARAGQRGVPVAIINQGPTRCDADALIRVDAPLSQVLSEVWAELDPASSSSAWHIGADRSLERT